MSDVDTMGGMVQYVDGAPTPHAPLVETQISEGSARVMYEPLLLEATSDLASRAATLARLRHALLLTEQAAFELAIAQGSSVTAARESAKYQAVNAQGDVWEAEAQLEAARARHATFLVLVSD